MYLDLSDFGVHVVNLCPILASRTEFQPFVFHIVCVRVGVRTCGRAGNSFPMGKKNLREKKKLVCVQISLRNAKLDKLNVFLHCRNSQSLYYAIVNLQER